jgi:hypothetical protein
MNVIIKPSNNQNKKITAIIDDTKNNNKKIIHFGAKLYEDYAHNKDEKRKKAYLSRHKHDNFYDPLYAGFYASNLLWNKPTLKQSIVDTNRKYQNINIKLKS